MSITKTYTLNGMRQLVDLNGDLKNFKLTFHAASQCASHFYAVVADQKTLDENATLEFRTAEGEISAEIVMDKDVYQNYFLVLKAKDGKTCKVDVLIDRQEIAPKPKPPPPPQQPQHNPIQAPPVPKKKDSTNWKMIIIAVVVVAGAGLLYYFHTQNQKKGSESSAKSSSPISAPPSPVFPSSEHVPTPSVANSFPKPTINSSLLDRLRNLPMR